MKKLGSFSLAMLTVAAIISLRNLPTSAVYGLSSISYLLLAAILFFIPTALVSAELATALPKAGGSYIWVREALGAPTGFFSLWWAWMESIAWFPAILAFTSKMFWAAIGIYTGYTVGTIGIVLTILGIFWCATWINCYGIQISSWVSTIGVLLGTIIPAALIILLGLSWALMGKPLEITLSWSNLIPNNLNNLNQFVLFAGIILGFAGAEIAAFHAKETDNPKHDYPKALFMAVIIILLISILGSLAIGFVVPAAELNLLEGVLQAFAVFLQDFGLSSLLPILALCLFLGSLAGINAWTVGPAKGMLICAEDGFLPKWLRYKNKHDVPVNLLITQAIIGSILTLAFLQLSDHSSAYWILTALSAIFTVGQYSFIFISALVLRYKRPDLARPFKIPGGNMGAWIVCLVGLLVCAFTFFIGFLAPEQLDTGNDLLYNILLIISFLGLSLPPFVFIRLNKNYHDS